jgi:hypothetical protein
MKFPFLLLCTFLCFVVPAYPWGGDGHRAIAEAARGMLTTDARAKVIAILGNDDLAAVAGWLDDVRLAAKRQTGPLKDDAEAKEFQAKFPRNDEWHYVDLPVGFTKYSDTAPSASPNDIVHAIHHAIDVLEGKAADMTKKQALRVLVHLVGDAHQPLHATAGYFDCSDAAHPKLVSDPELARSKPHDRGGNQLFFNAQLQVHRYYDDYLPKDVAMTAPRQSLAKLLASEARGAKLATPGEYHHWAEQWIEESAAQAAELYRGMAFGKATLRADGSIDRIEITLPASFWERQAPVAKSQLTKAAVRLAQLLNAIRWEP